MCPWWTLSGTHVYMNVFCLAPFFFFTACSHHKKSEIFLRCANFFHIHARTDTLTRIDEASLFFLFFPLKEASCGPERQAVRASFSALTSQRENIGISTISSLITGSFASKLIIWSSIDRDAGAAENRRNPAARRTLSPCIIWQTYSARLDWRSIYTRAGKQSISARFLRTAGLWDVRCRNDCFILISCDCNKHFLNAPRCRFFFFFFLFLRRKMRMRRSVRRQKRKWRCPQTEIASPSQLLSLFYLQRM